MEKVIDYLQFTSPEIPDFLSGVPYPTKSPMPFYREMFEYDCGTRIFFGNVNSDKYLVQMAGNACNRHRMTEFTGRLEMVLFANCHFSRIDLAVTVEGRESLEKFRQAVRDGDVKSERFGVEGSKVISDAVGDTETVYVGDLKKRGRNGVFRAYDKGRDLGIEAMLTRFELEVRAKRADTVVKRLLAGFDMGDLIRAVVDIPGAEWWSEIMGSKSEELPRYLPEKLNDPVGRRWRWLMKQVAPSLAKLILIDLEQQTTNYKVFMSEVTRQMEKQQREKEASQTSDDCA